MKFIEESDKIHHESVKAVRTLRDHGDIVAAFVINLSGGWPRVSAGETEIEL